MELPDHQRENAHEFFFEDCERKIHSEHYPVVVCYLCFGRTEGRSGGGDLDVGGCAWRRRTRQGIATLFRRRRALGDVVPTVRADRSALRDYFVTAFRVLPGLKVSFGDQLIRVYGSTAVNTGYYTFTYVKDGETKIFPARYSFTYVKNGENWLIVDHHSSAVPQAPK
jgi:calcium/calmodulin dependent protein kinase II association protein